MNRIRSSIKWSNIIISRANIDEKCAFYYNVVTKGLNVTVSTVKRYILYYNVMTKWLNITTATVKYIKRYTLYCDTAIKYNFIANLLSVEVLYHFCLIYS